MTSGLPLRSARALDAAGILDPALRRDYETCRRLNAEHGRTYYLATALLPAAKRPYVWAMYGFARFADELVDSPTDADPQALLAWSDAVLDALDRSGPEPAGDDPVTRAMLHTVRRWDIPREHLEAFLTSMAMDITQREYPTYADLERYMYGSAAVVGLQLLPVLEPVDAAAPAYARLLGEAFQMSNFIRDVGEDLDRGRTYLPTEDLDRFGVDRRVLLEGRRTGVVAPEVRDLLAFEVARTRQLYARAAPGIPMLHPTSRDAIECAFVLYSGILEAVERAGYAVLNQRVSVSLPRRVATAVPALVRARRVRRAGGPGPGRPVRPGGE